MRIHMQHDFRQRQQGAALMVALVLMVVITILAMSAMGTSRLELLMAGNTQYGLQAFQAAQSAIDARLAAGGFNTSMSAASTAYPYPNGASGTASVTYQTSTEVPAGATGGYSLGSGYQAFHFEIDASGTASRGATSSQTQGFYIVGPGAT